MVTIVGAGLAGLLAANMLRRHSPSILEAQSSLPNNHHAVLRFRTEEVSRQLHIPFKRVRVFKSCDECDPIKAAMLYSKKVTGRYELRSLIDLSPVDRFIAPPNLISQMADGFNPCYDHQWRPGDDEADIPTISTMPMVALMDALGYGGERPAFVSHPGWVIRAGIADCEVYATRYYARHRGDVYRASITGDQLIIEATGEVEPPNVEALHNLISRVLLDFGIEPPLSVFNVDVHKMRYAKIGQLSTADRAKAKQFMFWATREHNVYSLGRFATWRAGLLLDDLVKDIITIERWIGEGAPQYDIRKEMSK